MITTKLRSKAEGAQKQDNHIFKNNDKLGEGH